MGRSVFGNGVANSATPSTPERRLSRAVAGALSNSVSSTGVVEDEGGPGLGGVKPGSDGSLFGDNLPCKGSEPETRTGSGPDASLAPGPGAGGANLGPDPGMGGGANLGPDPEMRGGADLGPDPGMGGGADLGSDPGMGGDSLAPESGIPGCDSLAPASEPPAGKDFGPDPGTRNRAA